LVNRLLNVVRSSEQAERSIANRIVNATVVIHRVIWGNLDRFVIAAPMAHGGESQRKRFLQSDETRYSLIF
jgi:hypothetical protein